MRWTGLPFLDTLFLLCGIGLTHFVCVQGISAIPIKAEALTRLSARGFIARHDFHYPLKAAEKQRYFIPQVYQQVSVGRVGFLPLTDNYGRICRRFRAKQILQ